MEMGNTIRKLRLQCGLTQEELGSALGLSPQAVSKWESGANLPDIQLLPELSVIFGVSIDELFSMSEERRMERIENMMENQRFIAERDFLAAESFLKERKSDGRAVLLLAQLYNKRSEEYRERAKPLAREALCLRPDEKEAHSALFAAENCPASDYNVTNRWELIEFYKDFLEKHPDNPRSYLWIMDLLIRDGRTAEARDYLRRMDTIEHSFRTALYEGLIAKEEGRIGEALRCWQRMPKEFPEQWLSWSSLADCMARLCRYDEALEYYTRAMELQPAPRYVDMPEAMAQICEIMGDNARAAAMREKCVEICRNEWGITEGEGIDIHLREIERLKQKSVR